MVKKKPWALGYFIAFIVLDLGAHKYDIILPVLPLDIYILLNIINIRLGKLLLSNVQGLYSTCHGLVMCGKQEKHLKNALIYSTYYSITHVTCNGGLSSSFYFCVGDWRPRCDKATQS